MVFFMIVWKSRAEVSTSWKDNWRDKYKTKSRNYALGSFFELIKTAITDPKDWKALGIKCDPAYLQDSLWKSRIESD